MGFFNLFSNPDKDLMEALTHGDMALMDKALARGANAGTRDKHGLTPIEIAAYNGYTPDVFEKLIAHGANVNTQSNEAKLSPLMISAAVSPYRDVIKILCENYAEIEAHDIQANTAIMWAISFASLSLRKNFPYHCPAYEIVEELIEWDANVNAVNKYGDSVFDKIDILRQDASPGKDANEINRIYNLLCANGAKPQLTFESFIGRQIHDRQIDVDFSKALISTTMLFRKASGQMVEKAANALQNQAEQAEKKQKQALIDYIETVRQSAKVANKTFSTASERVFNIMIINIKTNDDLMKDMLNDVENKECANIYHAALEVLYSGVGYQFAEQKISPLDTNTIIELIQLGDFIIHKMEDEKFITKSAATNLMSFLIKSISFKKFTEQAVIPRRPKKP